MTLALAVGALLIGGGLGALGVAAQFSVVRHLLDTPKVQFWLARDDLPRDLFTRRNVKLARRFLREQDRGRRWVLLAAELAAILITLGLTLIIGPSVQE